MSVLAFLRRHAAVVWLTTALLVVLGLWSALVLPSAIYPEIEFPRIIVVARTGGSPPDVFLTTVTRPLEQVLTSVLGVSRIRSKTIRGASEISLQFAPGTDMWRALQLTESRVAEARSALPADTEVIVERVTTGSFPVLTFNVAGAVDPRQLRETAEFIVRPALANVQGVGRIEVLGGDVREIEIILRPETAAALHLMPLAIADKLRTALGLVAVGRVDQNEQIVAVVADARPHDLASIAEMPIATTANGVSIPLDAVADIVEGHEDRTVRIGGPRGQTVSVSVARSPSASTPKVVEAATAAVQALAPSLPAGVTIDAVYDQATLVRMSMASVRDAILIGIALCAIVIAGFLRDARAGLLASIAVPLTLSMTFLVMRLGHQTLNLMSLGGMAVAIGLVVDDVIVIVEAIARRRDAGEETPAAAIKGTAELAPAVIGTTLTTVIVLVPLAFLEGIVGDFFRALSFTLASAVLISLAVALVLVPLAASVGMSARSASQPVLATRRYQKFAQKAVGRPLVPFVVFVTLLAVGALVAPRLDRGFLPSMDEGAFVLDYFLPAGTSLATTERFAKLIEQELVHTRDVATFSRRTGAELGPAAATQLNRGDIMVRLREGDRRSAEEVIADLRARIARRYPEVRVEFVQVLQDVLNDLAGSPRPIEVKLFGEDYTKLAQLGDELTLLLHDVEGLVDLYNGHEREVPQLRVLPRRDALARLGSSPDEAARELETALKGVEVGKFRRFDRLLAIRVRYPDSIRFNPERVADLPFVARDRATTFDAVVEMRVTRTPAELLHEALQPMVAVTGDHQDRDLGSVADDVRTAASKLKLPPGYRVVFGGQMEGQRATLHQLSWIGLVGILLVVTVLTAQFRRFRLALLIVAMVPAAIVGAVLSLWFTRLPLNASSLMGCVLLVGVVVKNGILLLEEAERQLSLGKAVVEAVVLATERRARPVLMTTIATLAGLLPLALGIGAGAELQRPLAVAVMGGLVTSTVATLMLIPSFAAYLLTKSSRLRAT